MAERKKIESSIRDWLADHLDFIAPDLHLIEKEYHLRDPFGAAGFIDLLCEDQFGNFVIVEIKRTENAARQTITEVLKYHALIKHNFKARDTEIRIIIISTSWNELIRPFSELARKSTLRVDGYEIAINEAAVPLSIRKVEPLDLTFLARKFTLRYGLFLFEKATERDSFFTEFQVYLKNVELDDFVILKLCTDPLNGKIMFPFATLAAFQQLPIDQLLKLIMRLDKEAHSDLYQDNEFDDPIEYRVYLESVMVNSLETLDQLQESEFCSPFKVYTMLNAENWSIELINRFGIFEHDPRYNQELLIGELAGLDGSNENIFYGWTESMQVERFNEIRLHCRNALKQSPTWLETIDAIMEKLSNEPRRFRLTVHIYNRNALITAVFHTISNRNLEYLPQYFISIDYLDKGQTELYYGSLLWNNNWPESPWVNPMTIELRGERLMELMIKPNNQRDARELGLCYGTTKYNLEDDGPKFEGFLQVAEGKLERQDYYILPFVQYAVIHEESLNKLVENFGRVFVSIKD